MNRCPYCPRSARTFSSHGLKIHIGRKHKDVVAIPLDLSPTTDTQQGQESEASVPRCPLEALSSLKESTPVLRHVPKGARTQAAGKLCDLINMCVDGNDVEDWFSLLSFAFAAFRVPSKTLPGNMTTKVRKNIQSSGLDFVNDDISPGVKLTGHKSKRKSIESKVFEGDLRGAVRLLVSEDSFASYNPDTLASLRLKHPSPSRALSIPPAPDESHFTVTVGDVAQALGSFYSGSAAGLDGIRPGHLKELTSRSAGDQGGRLLESLANLMNFMLSGKVNPRVCPYLYGAALCALSKKDGGLRPIAIGSVFRRLCAKLACSAVRDQVSAYLQPHQLGFGTRLGCEAAIHATRAFILDPNNANCVVLKLDVRNAFNSLERDVLLSEVRDKVPSIYPFIHQMYQAPSNLYFNGHLILSQVGAQQGDPLGPLVFSLAIQSTIAELKSPLNVWYLDDGTIGGDPETVYQDLQLLIPRFGELGLEVNPSKCEFFPCSKEAHLNFPKFDALQGLSELSPASFNLLGSPMLIEALPGAITARKDFLGMVRERLEELPAHVALVLLRNCFALPRINFLMRTSPTWLCPEEIMAFDNTLKSTVESVINVSLSEDQWNQAALPIRLGGIGIRRARDVGLPAFLASAHGVADLVAVILPVNGNRSSLPFVPEAISAWSAGNSGASCPMTPSVQRVWDDVGSKRLHDLLLDNAIGTDLARLRAVSQPESGSWLHALPSPHLGTFLDDDSLRVAVALRLGCRVCEPHKCICGSMVGDDGHHALSCRRCMGRFPRHHALNDIIRRAFVSANIPCVLEPPGLSRSDGKRPDGLTLVPWKHGRSVVWDATCVSTVAASHLSRTTVTAAAAAEDAAERKRLKYAAMEARYTFIPIAVETMGCWGVDAKRLVRELGQRLADRDGDPRSGMYLMQRLAIAIQRGNAASVLGTFAPDTFPSS